MRSSKTSPTQWLNLGKIAGVKPDEYVHPEFDENLRDAMLEETRRFLTGQIREDRSVVDLLSADYTFINERLARHYGIPDVFGNQFRRVTFKDGVRGGLLGQASILTVTSYPNRTSPVVRGKWLLDNMLGAPPPPPPPDVPTLVEPGAANQPRSVRERMEVHRRNPTCAACHVRMDPLGFALENFDALGKWRTSSDGVPVDAAASLPDGTQFEGSSACGSFWSAIETSSSERSPRSCCRTRSVGALNISTYPPCGRLRGTPHRAATAGRRWFSAS